HRPMLLHFDLPDRPEGRVRPPATVDRLPFGAVPYDEQHLVEPLVGLEAWVADPPLLSLEGPNALQVGGEHHVEAAGGLRLGGEGVAALPFGVGGADLFELRRLVAVGDAEGAHAPGLAGLGEG